MSCRLIQRRRSAYTVIEVMMAVVILGLVLAMAIPKVAALRGSVALRGGRQQFLAALQTARSAAVQKGKTSTLTLTGATAIVTVLNGQDATPVTVLGPLDLAAQFGLTVTPLPSTPSTLSYNARGLLTPTPSTTLRYQLRSASAADTVCVSTAGLILPKGCVL